MKVGPTRQENSRLEEHGGLSLRPARSDDAPALSQLERQCPQGTNFKVSYLKRDYAAKGEVYSANHTLVSAGSGDGPLVAVGSCGIKQARVRSQWITAACLHDFRTQPEYRRRGLSVRLGRELVRWAGRQGAGLWYVLLPGHLTPGSLFDGLETGPALEFEMLVVPVRPQMPNLRRTRAVAELTDDPHDRRVNELMESAFAAADMFVPLTETAGTGAGRIRYLGTVTCTAGRSAAGLGLWDLSTVQQPVIVETPLAMETAATLADLLASFLPPAVSRILPIPVLPRIGRPLTVWYAFAPFSSGPDSHRLFHRVLAQVHRLASGQGVQYLIALRTPRDAAVSMRGHAVLRLQFRLLTARRDRDVPLPSLPLYLDPRDI